MRYRAACVAGALALALVPAACGGSDDDGPSSDGKGAGGPAPSGIGDTADERRAVVVMEKMAGHMSRAEPAASCELMTDVAREEVAAGIARLTRGDGGKRTKTCADGLARILEVSGEDYEPTFRWVRVTGDRAIIAADASHVDETHRALLEREDGDWRVDTWFTNDETIRERLQASRARDAQGKKGG